VRSGDGSHTCGAKYGRGENDGRKVAEATYAKTRDCMDAFSKKHGTYICRELLNGCNVLSPEGMTYRKQHDLLNETCKSKPCADGSRDS
jgi:hypothetical protein